ncbi:MAG: PAS domain S-box protein [Pseudomonadota bacterium]
MDYHPDDLELREQLDALVKTAVDGIVSVNADGVIRLVNPAMSQMFGYTPEELLGQNIRILMPDRHGDYHDGYMHRYMETGEARIIGKGRDLEGRRKDGAEFPVHLSIGEFHVQDRRYFVGILRDLTDEVAERARLRTMEDQLALLGRRSAVAEMGASLAHELNQPLTAIDLFLTAAKRAFEHDPHKALSLFDDARDEVQRAGEIVRRIRKMVEQSDQEKTLFALKPVLEDAVKLCQLTDRQNAARIEVAGADNVIVHGDEIQIRQILVNLIKNALEATERQNDRLVDIHVAKRGFIDIEVADNGPGVDPSIAPALFEPFHSTKPKGLGIGLSICRSIAENHGGELVHVADRSSASAAKALNGACFRLRLPDAPGGS